MVFFLLHVALAFFLFNIISRWIQTENEGEGYHDCAVGGLVDILLLILLSAWPLLLAKLHKLVEQWRNEAQGSRDTKTTAHVYIISLIPHKTLIMQQWRAEIKWLAWCWGMLCPFPLILSPTPTANWCLALQMTCQSTKRRERRKEEGAQGEDWGGCCRGWGGGVGVFHYL